MVACVKVERGMIIAKLNAFSAINEATHSILIKKPPQLLRTCKNQEAGCGNVRLEGLLNVADLDSPVLEQAQRPRRLGLGVDFAAGVEQPGGG